MNRPRRNPHLIAACALVLTVMTATLSGAAPAPEWDGTPSGWQGVSRSALTAARSETPEDRYAMAGGCYAIRSARGGYLVREGSGFLASGTSLAAAEPFHFQATDLGRYLLLGRSSDFVASSEGLAAQAADGATRSQPGSMAGGVTVGATDQAADAVAGSKVNSASGRGGSVIAAPAPSDLADWEIVQKDDGDFSLALPSTNEALFSDADGGLLLVSRDAGVKRPKSAVTDAFSFELTDNCASFPEVDVNVDGPILGGETGFQEVRGFLDAHLHMMAFEFLGGRARCGRPWHRFGVDHALVDCPDHEPNGYGAVLEKVVSRHDPHAEHDTDGWPTFAGWPRHDSLTHEQVYYKWMERAWRGGLRMFVNLLVDNNQLCKIYPFKRNSCNEMDGVRLQARRIRELERYIDAQSGGPGEGWFRIVKDPFEARRVINEGKLAVVLGIEVSVPLDCGITLDEPKCDTAMIDRGLDEVFDLGVRQMELVNKFDNAFSGVKGDSGSTGVVVNGGNFLETGRFWQLETCTEDDGHAHDHTQYNFHDESGAPDEFSGRDALVGGILSMAGTSGAAPIYPEGPHCNVRDLDDLGEAMIRGMVERGMIFDPDHMSARAQTQALDLVESLGHSGVVSSHGWANSEIYPRIYKLGGVVTPYAGGSSGFVNDWRQHKPWADDRFTFGFGFGSDVNGFGSQGGPRGATAPNKVEYPFTGLGGAQIEQQKSGERLYDINSDGLAHYGLYPDWIEDLRRQAGQELIDDMVMGPEAYLQMWERSIGIAPDACRADVPNLTFADLGKVHKGMSAEQIIRTLGQPSSRTSGGFEYCVGEGEALLRLSQDGNLMTSKVRK